MLKRMFSRRQTDLDPVPRVRAEPDFMVEGGHIVARGVRISWQQSGQEASLRLRRNLRPADPVVMREPGGLFGLCLRQATAPDKIAATGLDFQTASDLHRIVWNWLGQLCQNGHDPFPIKLTLPEAGFDHDSWPEALGQPAQD